MKLRLLFFLSSIVSFSCISAMRLPLPLARIDAVSFNLCKVLKKELDYFGQHSQDPFLLQAKKKLSIATINNLNAIRRLAWMSADPITLHSAIAGIVPMDIIYVPSPPEIYLSDKAQLLKLADGKIVVRDHTQHYINHMLNILRPYYPPHA